MPIEIKYTSDVKVNGVKLVVYGASGVGKTVLCSTAPKPIIISAEQGLLSLVDQNIPYIEVRTLKDIGDAYNILKENDDFDTICLDSISEITEVVHDFCKREIEAESSGKIDLRRSYMSLASKMMPMIRKFRDIKGKHVVFTAKQKRYEDEYTGRINMEPMLPGQVVSGNLPYLVDEVIYMDIGKTKEGEKRFLQCKAKVGLPLKDRSGKLNEKEEPDLTKLFNKIIGEN